MHEKSSYEVCVFSLVVCVCALECCVCVCVCMSAIGIKPLTHDHTEYVLILKQLLLILIYLATDIKMAVS